MTDAQHVCDACGEGFPTLTKKRLHQKDDCPGLFDEIDADDDDVAAQTATDLLTCRNCEEEHDGSFSRRDDMTDAGYSIEVKFACEHCGFHNQNTAILATDGGRSARTVDDTPTHPEAVEQTRERLPADDPVGNALCDVLAEEPRPALKRVINWYGPWSEAAPTAYDIARTLELCPDVSARFDTDEDTVDAVLVRASPGEERLERVSIHDDIAVTHAAGAGRTTIGDLRAVHGGPELVPTDDVRGHFEDGGSR